jgi:hypothetical protein
MESTERTSGMLEEVYTGVPKAAMYSLPALTAESLFLPGALRNTLVRSLLGLLVRNASVPFFLGCLGF